MKLISKKKKLNKYNETVNIKCCGKDLFLRKAI